MLKLQPSPTFKAKVEIPVPGASSIPVTFEFKHMTRDALNAFLTGEGSEQRSYEDTVAGIVVGWEGVDAAYGREALATLFQNYMGAPTAILETYGKELNKARLGN